MRIAINEKTSSEQECSLEFIHLQDTKIPEATKAFILNTLNFVVCQDTIKDQNNKEPVS